MEIMKFCYLCFDRTKDVYPVVDETFMQKFINFSPGNITVSKNYLYTDSHTLQLYLFDNLHEWQWQLIVVLFCCGHGDLMNRLLKHIVQTINACKCRIISIN